MENILITGGAGFIGSNFVHYMNKIHPEMTLVIVDSLTYACRLENLTDLPHPENSLFIEADIRDKKKMEKIVKEYNIDTLFNFAAESHVDRSIEGPELFFTTNVLGTLSLLEAAMKAWKIDPHSFNDREFKPGVKFIQISTDEVYGTLEPEEPAFTEQTPLRPNSPYSASKTSADLLVRSYNETYGLPVNITRCSNNYGPRQFPEKLIPMVIECCLKRKSIPVYGDGKQIRDWLHVEDHCSAIEAVGKRGLDGEVYNIGGINEWDNLAIVTFILDKMGRSHDLIQFVDDRPGHDRRYAMDNKKITSELGWQPTISFEEGLSETIDNHVSIVY
ncbi:MAG: dTDP-glucose 4,6-dehydratase [Pisciglobus halotolerans]|nr:dTDP-glucose 4,6-dehydratase [Pisciglobus halotolerans]